MSTASSSDRIVKIAEMSARDGLQNEQQSISAECKIALVNRLADAGLRYIEAGSFVSPKWVPQMANSNVVFAGITRKNGVTYAALTPNMRGWENALAANVDEVAVFASASESFSQKNLNCDIATSLSRFEPVVAAARQHGIAVRGYVSCILDCPYDGAISPSSVEKVTHHLLAMGCYQVSLGDTIGTGTPGRTRTLLHYLNQTFKPEQLALHMHDTYGQAIANIFVGLDHGIRTFDASTAGLGGCPYAQGASGNVATEDLVYLLDREGFYHGIDLDELCRTGEWISQQLNKSYTARAGRGIRSKACI
ncbi:MAG: hydroxymethylglutaryl-CoA lyase [Alteromonadaceae bacterium]|nr:hydroxymethylglutaryl-CoA lyase [Alteromonadaceae bacterium]